MFQHLEQRRFEENRHRFYAVETGQDLFGAWLLWRRWGRIGTRGRSLVESFGSADEADLAAEKILHRKRLRGYAEPPAEQDGSEA